MEGVSVEAGLCTERKDTSETDMAYRIDKKIQLSAPTKQFFPDSGFPENFSLMTTVKAKKNSQFFLVSLYDEQGVQQLGLEMGRSPVFLYEDHQGQPAPDLYPIFKKINLADGKWHRIAYSIEGKSVTLYLDCKKVQTLELMRGDNPAVSTDGVVVFGTRLLDEEVCPSLKPVPRPWIEGESRGLIFRSKSFSVGELLGSLGTMGEIQQLLLVDDPQAAADYCQDYIPDCDSPLPYSTQRLAPEEVSDFPLAQGKVSIGSRSEVEPVGFQFPQQLREEGLMARFISIAHITDLLPELTLIRFYPARLGISTPRFGSHIIHIIAPRLASSSLFSQGLS
ncbi:Collagen alpha-1(V) chain [Labeo rohita]|uniref:Collagen alpha-1(V) chain n=1 Tax=Labeo rohita TaxID=84645 RepID=A0ABQ8MTZ0_LABRO|nr:Collagen alpha-1(V) chain [Labeo rohita]